MTVGIAAGLAGEVRLDGLLAAVDRHGRKFALECRKRLVDRLGFQCLAEVRQGILEDAGVALLAVGHDHQMQDLMDQRHRVDLAGFDCLLGETKKVALLVHLLGELPGRAEIGNHDGAAHGKQVAVKLIEITRVARDVEFPMKIARRSPERLMQTVHENLPWFLWLEQSRTRNGERKNRWLV